MEDSLSQVRRKYKIFGMSAFDLIIAVIIAYILAKTFSLIVVLILIVLLALALYMLFDYVTPISELVFK